MKLIPIKLGTHSSVITGAGPTSIKKASRVLKKDVKATHIDVHVLLDAGIK